MRFVIDANVFAGFYRSMLGRPLADLTVDPTPLFDFNSAFGVLVIDEGGMIEHEWMATVDRDWCKAWMGDALIAGHLTLAAAKSDASLIRLLKDHGFPVSGSRDIWYLRLMDSFVGAGNSGLVSEDLDFYQPDRKSVLNGQARIDYLLAGRGSLRKALAKRGIDVGCIGAWLQTA